MKTLCLLFAFGSFFLMSNILFASDKPDNIQRKVTNVFDMQENTVSNVDFFNSNFGIFGLNSEFKKCGVFWPRGTENSYLFASGIWFAAVKYIPDSSKYMKMVSITYNPNNGRSWFVPGRIEDCDTISNDSFTKYRIYFSADFARYNGNPIDPSDGPAWPLWRKGETPYPYLTGSEDYVKDTTRRNRTKYPIGPNMFSDEDVITTFKDTDLSVYDGGSQNRRNMGYPLRLQFDQRIFSWTKNKPLSDAIILSYAITNTSKDTLADCYFGGIYDIDLMFGSNNKGVGNDRIRYYQEDPTLNLFIGWTGTEMGELGKGFGYIGVSFIETPSVDANQKITHQNTPINPENQIGMTGFRNWTISEDINRDDERYAFMAGKNFDGDSGPKDCRSGMFTGPFTFLPGESTRIAVLIVFAMPSVKPEADGSMADLADLVNKVKFARKFYYDPTTSEVKGTGDESGFSVSPSPATDFIEISDINRRVNPTVDNSSIKIFNVFGQAVLSVGTIHELPLRINTSALPLGVYFVRIGDRVSKFVKI